MPPVSSHLAGPIARTAEAVASRRISAESAVDEALRRIGERDASLAAVVELRSEQALAEARALDRRLDTGEQTPGPLCGVPLLVKDLEDVAGMVTRKGSLLLADANPAVADDACVARLRQAGAIVVGKSNLPEFATEGFTDNLLYGATHNPWNPALSPGGSSGGSAAALASGMVPLATATDGGGSVRIPAAFCGLLGLKPTHGRVGRRPTADWLDFSTEGPLATEAADLRLVDSILAGMTLGDPDSAPGTAGDLQPVQRLFAAQRTSDLGPLDPELAGLFDDAVAAMAELLGLQVEWLEPGTLFAGAGDPDLDWFVAATAEHVAALGRSYVGENLDRMHPATQTFMRDGLSVDIDSYLAARRRRFEQARRVDELLDGAGLLLTPTVAATAWTTDGRLPGQESSDMLPPAAYSTAMQNVTGHPALSLPAGISAIGLPFGLQVTATRWRDADLLNLAEAWQAAHPWAVTAPGYDPFDAG